MNQTNVTKIAVLLLMAFATGCDREELLELAKRHNLSEQDRNRLMAELHGQVAEGSREMVASDALARKELVTLHREVQAERAEFGRQRDVLEEDRKQLAVERKRDSLTASAIISLGTLAACLAPLVICWCLLRCSPDDADDSQVAELLLSDVVAGSPVLLERSDPNIPKLNRPSDPGPEED